MIERSQIVSLLSEKIPSFREPYNHWFEDEGAALIEGKDDQAKADMLARARRGDSSGVLIYLLPLPQHLKTLHQKGNFSELNAAAELIELLIIEGDEYISTWAVIGMLEGIQNTWSEYGSDKFILFLRQESLKAWNELDDFWLGRGKWQSKWIGRNQILSLLIGSVPAFGEPFRRWAETGDDVLQATTGALHTGSSAGSQFDIDYYKIPVVAILFDLYRAGKMDDLRAAAALIETFVVRGDAYVSEWAVKGIVCAIKAEWPRDAAEAFLSFLEPKSRHYWSAYK